VSNGVPEAVKDFDGIVRPVCWLRPIICDCDAATNELAKLDAKRLPFLATRPVKAPDDQ
jgi:hypothetical protein